MKGFNGRLGSSFWAVFSPSAFLGASGFFIVMPLLAGIGPR